MFGNTSSSYCLRCNSWRGALGLEPTPGQYVENMMAVFREVWRVLRSDGTCWINLGSSYAGAGYSNHANTGGARRADGGKQKHTRAGGFKPKDLIPIPWMVAMALQADGWFLRSDIVWHKPNPMPESVTDRPTKSHEYLFLLTKQARYYYNQDAVREKAIDKGIMLRGGKNDQRTEKAHKPDYWLTDSNRSAVGRNRRTVWSIATAPYSGAHFATYPPALVEPCIKAGTSEHGVCPECGAGWEREKQPTPEYQERLDRAKNRGDWYTRVNTHVKGQPEGGFSAEYTTTGWRPTCQCEAGDPIPATILDPFTGSGTSLLVARRLGRHAIGLDLSYPYLVNQARKRLELDKLDEWNNGREAEANLVGLPLFQSTEG